MVKVTPSEDALKSESHIGVDAFVADEQLRRTSKRESRLAIEVTPVLTESADEDQNEAKQMAVVPFEKNAFGGKDVIPHVDQI